MIPVLSGSQMKAWDQYTITHTPISSVALMGRAAMACSEWLMQKINSNTHVVVLCGHGNNGGDGFAIANILHAAKLTVTVYVLPMPDEQRMSSDAVHYYRQLPDEIMSRSVDWSALRKSDVIVDAMYGTGLSRKLGAEAASLVEQINSSAAYVVSIDLPSGLMAEGVMPGDAVIVNAAYTLTFEAYKINMLMPSTAPCCGTVVVLQIGLLRDYEGLQLAHMRVMDGAYMCSTLKGRMAHSTKFDYGHALIIGAGRGMCGAGILATGACLRAGVGLVTLACDEVCAVPLHTQIVEAMAISYTEIFDEPRLRKTNAIAVGPGLGIGNLQRKLLADLLRTGKPMVVDADAINIMAADPALLALIKGPIIFTPHKYELQRLIGAWENDVEMLEKTQAFCLAHGAVVVVKNNRTMVVNGSGSVLVNVNGNAGMATAGSGDVLTGIVVSLLAQGYAPDHAAAMGVYVHGAAGDVAAAELSMCSMTAGDIVEKLCVVFKQLEQSVAPW